MFQPQPALVDQVISGSGQNHLDHESPLFGAPQNSATLNALLRSTDALFAGAMEIANLEQKFADSLSDLLPFAEQDEPSKSPFDAATGGGNSGLGLETQAVSSSEQTNDLPGWYFLPTDGTVLAVDYNPGFVDSGHDAYHGSGGFVPNAGLGYQFSAAGDLIFLDFKSYAKPADPGGGGGNGGGGNGNKGGGGEPTDPNVISDYISGQLPGLESPYNIEISFEGSWTSILQEAFIDSAEWISSIIFGDLQDVFFRGNIIDDLKISAELVTIDGVGGVLGQAGPTAYRTANFLPAMGIMEFDVADAQDYYEQGYWDDIVLHEMLHTVGFGTMWDLQGLIDDSSPENPTFTGTEAVLAYQDLFGGSGDVPLEYGFGSGTDRSHWDEALFDNELMTGFIDTNGDDNIAGMTSNYVSGMTVASLADLGYSIDPTSYDQQVEVIV